MDSEELIYPREIILEITNKCNLKCRFCHFHGEEAQKRRKIGDMDRQVWEKVLDDIEGWNRPCSILTHGAGEPLLYPELIPLLTRAVKIPHLFTGFMTNGMLLTREMCKKLVELQVNSVAFSIDGVDPVTHDHFRKNANLKIIEENVETLIREKERAGSVLPSLVFNMVGYPEILNQTDDYVAKWLPHAAQVTLSKFRPVGSRRLWDDTVNHGFVKCPLLYSQMVISIDGDVGLCCEDINLDVPLGNVMDEDLLTIFNRSRSLSRYRACHERGEIDGLKLCSDCHVWGSSIILEERDRRINGLSVHQATSPSGVLFNLIRGHHT